MYRFLATCLFALLLPSFAVSQVVVVRDGRRIVRPPVSAQFRIQEVSVNATLKDQVATVQMAQVFENQSSFTIEAQFLFPLPEGAAISDLTLVVDGKELTGELKKREDARRIYESIVRQQKDPALLEYIGNGVFRTSVFPIPARQKRRVEIRYTQLLKKDSGLVDFTLPLGTLKHTTQPIEKAVVSVRLDTTEPLKTVYSPTHDFDIDRPDETRARCSLTLRNVVRPSDVRLMFGTRGGDVGMNLISYRPHADQDGYFLLLASPRVRSKKGQQIPKTVVFVVDRSGSMSGEKIDQAKAALKYMVNQLGDKDTFNIVSYSSDVDVFREELEVVNADTRKAALAYIDDIYSGGGTNINDALTAALTQLKDRKRPSYVMFFTDGLPTVGVKDERRIAANAKKVNEVASRVFSFGVGYDVNSRLLDRLSRDHRGTSVYVKPTEDIEVASSNMFRKVSAPVLTDIAVRITPQNHDSDRRAIKRVYPRELTDLFRGEQLVMVGRYRASGPARVVLTGEVNGKKKKYELDAKLDADSQTATNSYVEKLWATRRIGEIIDELDLNGRNQELIDELVALSLRHGIMTPYTAFLADENVQLTANEGNVRRARMLLGRLGEAGGASGFRQREFKKALQAAPTAEAALSTADAINSFDSGGGAGAGQSAQRGLGGGGGLPSAGRAGSRPNRSMSKISGFGGLPGKHADEESGESRRRERIRRIGTKTFYWKENAWRDAEFDDQDKAKQKQTAVIEVEQFSKQYFELAAKDKGKWSKYLSLKERVEVVLEGKRYRIVPAKDTAKSQAKEEAAK